MSDLHHTPDLLAHLLALSTPDHALPGDYPEQMLYEAGGYRWLCYPEGAVQCVLRVDRPRDLLLPHLRAMVLAAALPPSLDRILDLGTGGGGFLRFFAGQRPRASITSVDDDSRMQRIAREHFGLPSTAGLLCMDGLDYLSRERGKWDLILVDLFRGRISPATLADEGTLETLRERLAPAGAVAMNTLPQSAAVLVQLLERARRVFAGVGVMGFPSQGNVVLVLSPEALPDRKGWQDRLDSTGLDPGIKIATLSSHAARAVQHISLEFQS